MNATARTAAPRGPVHGGNLIRGQDNGTSSDTSIMPNRSSPGRRGAVGRPTQV